MKQIQNLYEYNITIILHQSPTFFSKFSEIKVRLDQNGTELQRTIQCPKEVTRKISGPIIGVNWTDLPSPQTTFETSQNILNLTLLWDIFTHIVFNVIDSII